VGGGLRGGQPVVQVPHLRGSALALGLGGAGPLLGGGRALALGVVLAAGLAELFFGAGLQPCGGGLALGGDQREAGLGGLGAGGFGTACGGLGAGLGLAAVVLGALARSLGGGRLSAGALGLAGMLGGDDTEPVELVAGLLQLGGCCLAFGPGLVPLAQGVVAGLLGRAAGAFVLGDLSPGVAGVGLGLGDLGVGLLPGAAGGLLGGLRWSSLQSSASARLPAGRAPPQYRQGRRPAARVRSARSAATASSIGPGSGSGTSAATPVPSPSPEGRRANCHEAVSVGAAHGASAVSRSPAECRGTPALPRAGRGDDASDRSQRSR
jgi:hypothetical protein